MGSRSRRWSTVVRILLLAVLVSSPVATATGATPVVRTHEPVRLESGQPGVVGQRLATVGPEDPQPDADNTITRIELQADGDARWIVRIRTRLDDDESVETFRAFQQLVRNDTSRFVDPFRSRIRSVVGVAAGATGREMRATNFTLTTSTQAVPRRWGIVTYAFTWEGFAARDGRSLVVGDAFDDGFLIAENDTLRIVAPSDYEVTEVRPRADGRDNGTVTWTGRRDFADSRPHVVLSPVTADRSTDGTAEPPGGAVVSGLPPVALLAAAVLAASGLGGVYWWRRRDGRPTSDDAGSNPPVQAKRGPVTDAERVRTLVADNGGTMKQSAIVEELDWSKSKVSRVLSRLEEDDEIARIRIGRENVVELREE